MDRQDAFLDEHFRPHACQQFVLRQELAWMLNQRSEQFESFRRHRIVPLPSARRRSLIMSVNVPKR
jgi:hypothetical protein